MFCDLPDIYADSIGNLFEICLLVCGHGMQLSETGREQPNQGEIDALYYIKAVFFVGVDLALFGKSLYV